MFITADGGRRGGDIVELKAAADKALDGACDSIEKVVVFNRCGRRCRCSPAATSGGTTCSRSAWAIARRCGSTMSSAFLRGKGGNSPWR